MAEDEQKANIAAKSTENGDPVYGSRTAIDKYDRVLLHMLVSQIVFAEIILMQTSLTRSSGASNRDMYKCKWSCVLSGREFLIAWV